MVDLSTEYLGLKLKNPLVPSASPLSEKVDTIRKMEDAGAAADQFVDSLAKHADKGHALVVVAAPSAFRYLYVLALRADASRARDLADLKEREPRAERDDLEALEPYNYRDRRE